jgi:hypothetical protein
VSSRAARRRRSGAQVAVKARPPAGGVTYTGEQVAQLLMATRQNGNAAPMPVPPSWAVDPFGPGRPLPPAPINKPRPDTGRAEPRLWEYPVSTNLQIDSRRQIPWRILQEAADIPLFRKCIERRKSICNLGFSVGVDPDVVAREAATAGEAKQDVEKALRKQYADDIAKLSDFLAEPDRANGMDWTMWCSALMENQLVFDATCIYTQRSFGNDVLGFNVIDGKTIKILLDERGGRPQPPFPAWQQIMYGFPRGEFTAETTADGKPAPGFAADQLLYKRRVYRPHTPYGMSPTEIAILDGMVWMRRMGWILAEYTEGAVPTTILETDNAINWDVAQWEAWLHALNDQLGGNTSERMKFRMFPPGVKAVQTAEIPERYKPDYDLFLIKLVAGDFGMPASEIGFTEPGALGASFHEGEEDILYRQTRLPDAQWLGGIATELAVKQLGAPAALQVSILGLESEDEAAADAVALQQVQSGRMTLNQDNDRRGVASYDFPEADMPMLMTARGVVFLEGASKSAPPGTLIGPAMAPPTAAPPGGVPGDPAAGAPAADDSDAAAEPEEPPGGKPAAAATAKAEAAAFRSWMRKGHGRNRLFTSSLTRAEADRLAPELLESRLVVFKDADAGPKALALAGRGLAGTGTRR